MHRRFIAICSALACVLAGCGAPPPSSGAASGTRTEEDKTTPRLHRVEYDKNGDGKPDTWAEMDGNRIVRIEVDDDGDGQVDDLEYYAAPGETEANGSASKEDVDPLLERIERATRHDGRISRWEYFEHGELARAEEDTNGDGRVDKWETYVDGSLSLLALDMRGGGRPDRRLIYRPDGSFDRLETDPTGSGTFVPVKP